MNHVTKYKETIIYLEVQKKDAALSTISTTMLMQNLIGKVRVSKQNTIKSKHNYINERRI